MQSLIHKAASEVTIYQGVRNMDPVHNLVTLPYKSIICKVSIYFSLSYFVINQSRDDASLSA